MKKIRTLINKLRNTRKKSGFPWRKRTIMVNPDIAFKSPTALELAKLREAVEPVEFADLAFEDDINNYNLTLLSKEATEKIIAIIKEDERQRINIRYNTLKGMANTFINQTMTDNE